jgi:3-hydroxyacyl-[acyl-carrier-protein] dehydratase
MTTPWRAARLLGCTSLKLRRVQVRRSKQGYREMAGKMVENGRSMATIAAKMRFILIDKIVEIETGKRIKAVKGVTLAEEYLADHFPTFPVLPGVLMLEGLIESASWLVRATENFAHSMVLLKEARNVKYKSFLAPGTQIQYSVEAKTIEENVSSFAGVGISDGVAIVEARFGLRHFNLADKDSTMAAVDAKIIGEMKKRWELLKS